MKNVMVLLVLIIISSAVVYSNSAVRFLQVHLFDLLSGFFSFLFPSCSLCILWDYLFCNTSYLFQFYFKAS